MNWTTTAVLAALLILVPYACTTNGAEESVKTEAPAPASAPIGELNTFEAKASYALGQDVGNSLKRMIAHVDIDILVRGLRDKLEDKEPLLDQAEAAEVMKEFSKKMQEAMTEEKKSAGEKNLKEGEAFLAENKAKEGVVTTESGLQYKVIVEGEGASPKATDQVTVHYRGTLIDGTEFDSSHKRGQPATFGVNRVIAGWTEALQLMKVGSKYNLVIPSDLAYGERGAGQQIGPGATLMFEVELIEIKE